MRHILSEATGDRRQNASGRTLRRVQQRLASPLTSTQLGDARRQRVIGSPLGGRSVAALVNIVEQGLSSYHQLSRYGTNVGIV
jgi:hypothetical protein